MNDLQQIVDQVAAAGWPRIMINASGFTAKTFQYLPQRTWAMARHFGLMSTDYRSEVQQAVSSGQGALVKGDDQFISWVAGNRAGSTAILKLEVSSQSSRFRLLSVTDQNRLLTLWARNGPTQHYRTIYPLFIPGPAQNGSRNEQYNSLTVGTFWQQRELMQHYG